MCRLFRGVEQHWWVCPRASNAFLKRLLMHITMPVQTRRSRQRAKTQFRPADEGTSCLCLQDRKILATVAVTSVPHSDSDWFDI